SMANAALNPDVMVTICNGEAKLYYTADYLTVLTQQAYIGELLPYDVNHAGVWFDDSSVYTNFLTDETGALVSNCGYDPITEAGCVKGGIITLREETYDISKGCYNLAIVPPAMLGGADYSTIDKDELTVHLRVTDFQKVAEYSEQNVKDYVKVNYPYDKSALRRQIDLAQTYLDNSSNYTSESIANLKTVQSKASEIYTESFNDIAESSNAYEEQISLVQTAIEKLEKQDVNNLADGKYIITGKMVKADGSDTASMSDAGINHTVVLNVKDGKYTAELEFKPIEITGIEGKLQNLWYYTDYTINSNGTMTGNAKEEATVAAKYDDGYPHYLDIELINKANYEYDYIPLHVYVPAMTGSEDQDVYLVLDWSTLAKADDISTLNGQSLTLPGVELPGFGLNFFMNFSAQTLADDGAKVVFTLPDGSIAEQLISESTKTDNGYKFTALVNAKEMTVPVKAQVVLSNGETGETYSCSVKKYADELLAMDGISEKTVKLVNALLNYGGYAQEYFGYETSDLANAGVPAMAAVSDADLEEYEMTVSGTIDGIEYYGSSLVLENSTAMNIYFKLADGKKATDFAFKAGKTTLTPTETGNGLCYVTVSGISAADLGAETTVSVGKLKVISSPYSYVYTALTKSQKEKLLNITKALYLYGEAAAAYVG
ncbi:MAG: NEAT domain-containing protein, partial [Oscillospiraceae bacterium]|nr:NEAT domain-containing protein [Oscillospiraceae bacterium]